MFADPVNAGLGCLNELVLLERVTRLRIHWSPSLIFVVGFFESEHTAEA
jgi:hypothetical protein